MRTAVFTIASNNYLPHVRVLMESVAHRHPDWQRWLLRVDRPLPQSMEPAGNWQTIDVENLGLPKHREFFFRYDILEMNTAAKPWMFDVLFARGAECVLYLDPDILLTSPLSEVMEELDSGAAGLLTPHLNAPIDDNRRPSEQEILRCGIYNLGFLALRRGEESLRFLHWWQEKLEFGAGIDAAAGTFTDQKWVDAVPSLFSGFRVLAHSGYNVAYWNLMHRPLTYREGSWRAGEAPLRFFHFSGLDPEYPEALSCHQDRFRMRDLGAGQALVREYARRLLAAGYTDYRRLPYAFGFFADGTPIAYWLRQQYRRDLALAEEAGSDPFQNIAAFTEIRGSGLNAFAEGLWGVHREAQERFPDLRSQRIAYLQWLLREVGKSIEAPPCFLVPLRLECQASAAASESPMPSTFASGIWRERIERLHWLASGSAPGFEEAQAYSRVDSLLGFLRMALAALRGQIRRRGWRAGVSLGAKVLGRALNRSEHP